MLTGTKTSKQNWVQFYPIRLIPLKPKFVSEALLDLLDPGLERSHVLLQLCEVALEDLASAALSGKSGLDPAKGLRDCVELLPESLQSAVDLIEVPEHVLSPAGYSRCAGSLS